MILPDSGAFALNLGRYAGGTGLSGILFRPSRRKVLADQFFERFAADQRAPEKVDENRHAENVCSLPLALGLYKNVDRIAALEQRSENQRENSPSDMFLTNAWRSAWPDLATIASTGGENVSLI